MRFHLCRPAVAIVSTCAILIALPDELPLSAQTRMSAPRFALRVPTAPTLTNGETGAFLVYELHLINSVAQPWTVQKVEVLSAIPNPRVLQTLENRELGLAIVRPGTTIPVAERTIFAGGAWGVVMMWVPVDRGAPPASLSHRVTFALDATAGAAAREVQGGETAVRRETVTIDPPLRGGTWRAGGFTNTSPHRRAMFGYGGDATINARFAIDYLKMGDDDRPFAGERTRNEHHHSYGQDVLAVADGRVAAIQDGVADNTFSGPSGPPDLDTIRGNHIILEIGPRVYATYAHLKPGSLRVATGQRVTRGQVIGLVGNTGASGAPHLHFQLSEAPDVSSDGVPFAHASFDVLGRCQQTGPALADQTCAHVPPELHRDEIPLNGMLIRFHEETEAPPAQPAPDVAGRTLDQLMQQLKSPDSRQRVDAASSIAQFGPRAKAAAPALIKALEDGNAQVRFQAAIALGCVGRDAKAAVPALTEALKDDVFFVRGWTAFALAEIGPEAAAAVPTLIATLKKPDEVEFVRRQVASALGRIGPTAVPELIGVLANDHERVRLGAILALNQIGNGAESAVPPLVRLLSDPAEFVRTAAASALGAIDPDAAVSRRATALRAPDGQPDLQGVWRVHTITPLERPAEFADKPFLTPHEASAYQARRLAALNLDSSPERAGLSGPSVNEFWSGDRGDLAVVAGRVATSLVVDPADGRIPPPTSARRAKLASRLEARRAGASAAAFNTSERCLRDGGAPLFGSPDRGLIEIIQTNTHVVIRQENLHDTRVVPLDGRPHVSSAIRSWTGDPRGSWDGDVLVVDSTNFTDLGDRFDENLHLVERFSRIDSETLLYEFTVDDPTVYTRPWRVVWPLKRSAGPLFEEACHEGNYSLPGMLRAVRLQEASR
jgi:murein DD-endopeptidase